MTMPTRPLKVPLHSDDVLFFLHIPKTAGLSLISILDSYYPPEQIFPLHSHAHHDFSTFKTLELARYRLVRGHWRFGPGDEGIYDYITPKPVTMTMLREPLQRTVSSYRHLIRQREIPTSVTLEEFLTKPRYHGQVYNRQATTLLNLLRREDAPFKLEASYPPDVLLHLAKERLDQLAFFGITERFKQSMQLMTYTFGWQPVEDIPEENRAPEPFEMTSLPAALADRLAELNEVDTPLYQFARQLFDERYGQMIEELLAHEAGTTVAPVQPRVLQANRSPSRPAIGLTVEEAFFLELRSTTIGRFLLFLRRVRLALVPRFSRREKAYYAVHRLLIRKRVGR